MMDDVPDVLQFISTLPLPSSLCLLVHLHIFLDQWKSIPSNRFVLNMGKGHHLQLRCHPPIIL